MLKTVLLCVLLFLSGCAIITPPTYHETEYSNLIEIAAVSSKGVCTPEQTEKLANLSTRAALYSKYLPNNELMEEGTALMDKSIHSLSLTPSPSLVYCSLKLRAIKNMATTLAEAVGGKTK